MTTEAERIEGELETLRRTLIDAEAGIGTMTRERTRPLWRGRHGAGRRDAGRTEALADRTGRSLVACQCRLPTTFPAHTARDCSSDDKSHRAGFWSRI